ncbi:hypothetical protein DK847_01065 [Aestuariivirga litoralis]|uniref:Glutamine amidotransferase domain-containing protein n=1 Tax=Aestuariivirga litoralis TaxID=2650924 RepID=A0A2W2BQG9_9HYPH|nr:hypothetical protein [Aestuariivirga litoralis]PZF78439.1 hypothetical protein DK847_01065 [Aestuariivirga litoralis]
MTSWNVVFEPVLPWLLIAAVGVAGLALLAALAFSRARGTPLRALALALLVAALANPVVRSEQRDPISDIAVAVVDRSLSQQNGQRPAQTEAAVTALQQAVARLPNTELRVVEVTSGAGTEDDGTRAFDALNRALADVPTERFAGALMITDGQVHDAPPDAAKSGIGGPLHGLITGSRAEKDRQIAIEKAPRFGIVGQEQTITFRLNEANGPGQPVPVTVTLGDAPPLTIDVSPGQAVEVPVSVDHAGQNIVEITAPPLDGEISLQNNRAVAVIEGVRDRLRVLLVSGEPHPGERTWRNLLKSDASVDLVHFTILRPPEKQDGTPTKELALIAFPTRELFVDKLDQFDLVIFDRYRRQSVLPAAYMFNIAQYVKDGGAVLIASGPDLAAEDGLYSTPLADIMTAIPTGDVVEEPFRPALTEQGKKHPVTKDLPGSAAGATGWGRWFRLVDTETSSGETVMSGPDNKPLLVLSRQDKGRVAQLLSDQGWLWARGFEGGGPQTELLRRLAHWLMKEPDLEEEALTGEQTGNTLLIERRTMADSAAPVTVTLPSGKTETLALTQVSPGRFQAQLPVTEAGLHRLTDGKLVAVAAGSGDAREMTSLLATTAIIGPVSAATGGGVDWLEDGMPQLVKVEAGRQMAGSGWIGLRANDRFRVESVSDTPLFATLLSLAVLLLALGGMWYRESR